MEKIFEFMRKSNRYKHLIGGFLVGICALSGLNAIYAAAVAATGFVGQLTSSLVVETIRCGCPPSKSVMCSGVTIPSPLWG